MSRDKKINNKQRLSVFFSESNESWPGFPEGLWDCVIKLDQLQDELQGYENLGFTLNAVEREARLRAIEDLNQKIKTCETLIQQASCGSAEKIISEGKAKNLSKKQIAGQIDSVFTGNSRLTHSKLGELLVGNGAVNLSPEGLKSIGQRARGKKK